ncbi:uncharacterized protein LOC131285452 [Anopheles ziemanni]|uniref:uncharacterized protein LOC131266547 n=1 Tax=Anopheles coustani TaxID=139045 RepID=UPI002659CAD9|nr:uncharacterized protein LOC131266547 [Anopheles coustani]XP_058170291.1 uncharacterized protein LOC131285452 [Anopheles ziemanni]
MAAQYRALLLVFLAVSSCQADLDPVFTDFDEELPANTMMPNERETIADCHLRFYWQGGRGIVAPAFAKPAFLTEFAHIGAIGWTGADGQIEWACGGSLIWNNFILTVAHCAENDNNVQPDVVRFGDLDLYSANDDTYAQQLRIVKIIRHPLHRYSARYYDIALMQLERNVTVHETVAPACLWFDEEVRFTELESAGWGRTGFGEKKTPILLKVNLKPVNNTKCTDHYNPTSTRGLRNGLHEHHICAGDAKMDTCPGDSGGPLQVRLQHNYRVTPFLVGLTSFGLPCGQSHPGVYTRVAHFRNWIVETLQQNGAPEVSDDLFEPQSCALRYVGLRQLAVSRVVANESGVFETFDISRQYITEDYMGEIVQLSWPGSTELARNNCMGAIIDHDTIVTLAECATNDDIAPSQVIHRFRKSFDVFEERRYDIKEIHVHPNHTDRSYYNNIAVLKIDGSIDEMPACIWNSQPLHDNQLELFATGRADLNIYQYANYVVLDPSIIRLTPRVFAYDNDSCSLAKQYLDRLDQGLLDQHLCFGNDPFLVPQVCELAGGGSIQRSVSRLRRFFKYVQGVSLFGRDCGFGEPAVAVRLQAHLGWLESVLLPNRSQQLQAKSTEDSLLFIDPDLELFDRCDFHDASVGLCVPVERCKGVRNRLRRKQGLIFCSNGTIVCCPPNDVMDDSQMDEGSQQIENCEQLYGSLRERNFKIRSEGADPSKPHLAEVTWVDMPTKQATFLCLGYLITTDSVLTTAMCTMKKDRRPNLVRLGYIMRQFEDSTLYSELESILIHPQFDSSTGEHNVALLKLAYPIIPTPGAFPGCLWRNETHTPLASSLLSIGPKQVLQEIEVHPQYATDCERILGRLPYGGEQCMRPSMYDAMPRCTTSNPVYWRRENPGKVSVEYLVGLFSHGSCVTDGYIVNTRITAYLPWIVDNV